MNKLANFLVESILNEAEKGITVMLPGGFKPPHEGHLSLAKDDIQTYRLVDIKHYLSM